jgi:hypothetical protein
MFCHYLVAMAGLVNLTQNRRLKDDEQFAFASQIEFCSTLGTESQDEAPSGNTLDQEDTLTYRLTCHGVRFCVKLK